MWCAGSSSEDIVLDLTMRRRKQEGLSKKADAGDCEEQVQLVRWVAVVAMVRAAAAAAVQHHSCETVYI
jgi:hypothetical protein